MSPELLALETLLLISVSYVGAALISEIIVDKDKNGEGRSEMLIILLYGGVGWITGFVLRAFDVGNMSEMSLATLAFVFALLGAVSYIVMTLIVEEVQDKMIVFK